MTQGLTVVTGESGAGKSIFLDAIGMVLGNRVSKSLIRPSQDHCEVSVEFNLAENEGAVHALAKLDLQQTDDPNNCIVRRVLRSDGRSRAFINDSPVNLSSLSTFCKSLVEIHSQHQNQELLEHRVQLRWLDDFIGASDGRNNLCTKVEKTYRAWSLANDELQKAEASHDDQTAQNELLRYQVEELDELQIVSNEYANLTLEQKRASLSKDLKLLVSQILEDLENGAETIDRSLRGLETSGDDNKELLSSMDLIGSSKVFIEEGLSELRSYEKTLDFDDEAINHIDQRLAKYHEVARKHKVKPEDLATYALELHQRLDDTQMDGARLNLLEEVATSCRLEYEKFATQLSTLRRKKEKEFTKSINKLFDQMGMKGASIGIEFSSTQNKNGFETVNYLVKTNPKYPAGSLKDLASGGELSRISLAIQVIAAEKSRLPCLILDEADVGIGGTTADVIGRLLRDLASQTQIVCVTHAPQVAALGDSHLLVSKQKQDTSIKTIDESARIEEISRMLGGRTITDETRNYAKVLYTDARKN